MLVLWLQEAGDRSCSHSSIAGTAHVKLAGGGIFRESLVEFGGVDALRKGPTAESARLQRVRRE